MNECFLCGDNKKLERHHVTWKHEPQSEIVVLCQRCHSVHHNEGYLSIEELTEIRKKVILRDPQRFKNDLQGKLL